jgi:hypothetical protein
MRSAWSWASWLPSVGMGSKDQGEVPASSLRSAKRTSPSVAMKV